MDAAASTCLLEDQPLTLDLKAKDDIVNEKERDVRRAILTHLSIAPERDLAFGLTLFSVVQEAERLGDLAKNLAKITALVQSSSTTTSMVVGIVAGGGLTVAGANPIMMGANVGTSITGTVVSLGHITRKDELRRAMAGATVHDFFNLIAVVFFLLPLVVILATRGMDSSFYEVDTATPPDTTAIEAPPPNPFETP